MGLKHMYRPVLGSSQLLWQQKWKLWCFGVGGLGSPEVAAPRKSVIKISRGGRFCRRATKLCDTAIHPISEHMRGRSKRPDCRSPPTVLLRSSSLRYCSIGKIHHSSWTFRLLSSNKPRTDERSRFPSYAYGMLPVDLSLPFHLLFLLIPAADPDKQSTSRIGPLQY